MSVIDAFDSWNVEPQYKFINSSAAAQFRAIGERAEFDTIRNAKAMSVIKKRFEPQLETLKKRIENRQKQIDDQKTSYTDKEALLKDQTRDRKTLYKLEQKYTKQIDPYKKDNHIKNGLITEIAGNLTLIDPGNNFRDWTAWMDRLSQEDKDGNTNSATPFAPVFGWVPGISTAA